MKNRGSYFILFFLVLHCFIHSQPIDLALSKAGACAYRDRIYVFGLRSTGKNTSLKVYRLNEKFTPADSVVTELSGDKSDMYLTCWADTLHGNLNIYTQKKDKQKVQINRFGPDFRQKAIIRDIEVTRLNNFSAFEKQIYRYQNEVYTIRITKDSTGKVFFLNKYKLRSDTTSYEYDQEWQFPFERRHVNSCRIVHVDQHTIIMYANVIDGDKRGQWLLKVNKVNGKLINGSRLNVMGQTDFYAFGHITKDSVIKGHMIFGVRYLPSEIDQRSGTLNAAGKKNITFFLAKMDSAGNLVARSEYTLPVIESKGIVYKTPVHYLPIVTGSTTNKDGNLLLQTDIYKAQGNRLCFTFAQSLSLKFRNSTQEPSLEKSQVGTNPMLEKYFVSNDPLDMNGKICTDSLLNFEDIFFSSPSPPVNIGFRQDEQNNPIWLLKKSDIKKNAIDHSVLSPVNKVYKLSKLTEVKTSENPIYIKLSKQVLIFHQSSEDRFQINPFNW